MNNQTNQIAHLGNKDSTAEDLRLCLFEGTEQSELFKISSAVKEKFVGNIVYF